MGVFLPHLNSSLGEEVEEEEEEENEKMKRGEEERRESKKLGAWSRDPLFIHCAPRIGCYYEAPLQNLGS